MYSFFAFTQDIVHSRFISPKIYDLIEDSGENYLIKLKRNRVLSRSGDLGIPCSEDENLTILHHDAYSEKTYQANSWRHECRICQFFYRKEGEVPLREKRMNLFIYV
ncbi:transposase [Streptococcus danieliae]|uniref:Transposase n=1 Tax=Streptococcus danieliae TaxID=747656 RepID=A0A7Z0M759_9STRE|nr:transposase [Streptococcus danieliae]NYS96926.1 transposase [Streptococcus danieliae]